MLDKITTPSVRFTQYDYTDISTGFFEAARVKFHSAGRRLNFRKLDICADVEQQGFDLASYDLIIAADVIHATPNMRTSLAQIRRLLKPTGSLALVELSSTTPSMFPFATLPGWWYRSDEDDDGAYVPENEWHDMLLDSGFRGVETSLKDLPHDHLHSVIWSRPTLEDPMSPKTVMMLEEVHGSDELSNAMLDRLPRISGIDRVAGGSLTAHQSHKGPHLILHELHRSVLAMPTNDDFAALQKLLPTASEVLWVVKGNSSAADTGHALYDFAFGFARSVRQEYTGLKFVVLQLDDCEASVHADNIIAVFQHCFVDNAGQDTESDFRAIGNVLQFPRLVPHARTSDFLMSKEGRLETEERPFCSEEKPLQLDMARAGSLDSMSFVQPS